MIFFRNTHRSSTKELLRSDFKHTDQLFQMGAEMHLLEEDRRKHLNNLLIGYLDINSTRNITADLRIIKFTSRPPCSKRD